MKRYTLILIYCCLSFVKDARSQVVKKDTIYYLIDTANTPINDRMITIEPVKDYKFFTIKCPCLSSGIKPAFRCNITNQIIIKRNVISSLKFIRLSDLIELVKKNDNEHFGDSFVVFFIEPYKRKYVKQRVFFLGSKIMQVN